MALEWNFLTIGSNIDFTSVAVNPDAAPTSTPRQGGFTLRNRWNAANITASSLVMCTVPDATPVDTPANNFRILEVPERVYVKDLFLSAVTSEAVPAFNLAGAQSSNTDVTATDLDTSYLEFGAEANKKPTSSASYVEATHLVDVVALNSRAQDGSTNVKGRVFGALLLTTADEDGDSDHHQMSSSATNVTFVDYFGKVDSSIASNTKPMVSTKKIKLPAASLGSSTASVTQMTDGMYFPYGGYVTMRLGPYATSQGASTVASITGWYSGTTGATISVAGVWEVQANCNYVPE